MHRTPLKIKLNNSLSGEWKKHPIRLRPFWGFLSFSKAFFKALLSFLTPFWGFLSFFSRHFQGYIGKSRMAYLLLVPLFSFQGCLLKAFKRLI